MILGAGNAAARGKAGSTARKNVKNLNGDRQRCSPKARRLRF